MASNIKSIMTETMTGLRFSYVKPFPVKLSIAYPGKRPNTEISTRERILMLVSPAIKDIMV